MLPIRLFQDSSEVYTPLGNGYSLKARLALQPLIDAAIEDGVSLRDLHYVITGEVDCMISEHILRRNMAARKAAESKKVTK